MDVIGCQTLGQIAAGKPPLTYPKDRSCKICGRKLSVYNRDKICGPCHEKKMGRA